MEVGVTLPMRVLTSDEVSEWARRVESGPFSSLNKGERLTFENNDPLLMLAIAASVTTRIRLATSVLCLPFHTEGVLAKQAATLERLSNGRFSLGVGIGERPFDFLAAPAEWQGRAEKFERQIEFMRRIWSGEAPVEGSLPVGPRPLRPGGPELIIGAFKDKALRRAGRIADGVKTFDFIPDPKIHRARYDITLAAWNEAGREGRPRFVAGCHIALGKHAAEDYEAHVQRYYGYSDHNVRWALDTAPLVSPTAIKTFIRGCAEVGMDELTLTPIRTQDLSALDELADVVADAGVS
jgi:alkanesulfonate monooxygenase SsuD/methylene tetrahydromethanopterin reductase-like flavin-dependent oxidoreductase (luciferase family)